MFTPIRRIPLVMREAAFALLRLDGACLPIFRSAAMLLLWLTFTQGALTLAAPLGDVASDAVRLFVVLPLFFATCETIAATSLGRSSRSVVSAFEVFASLDDYRAAMVRILRLPYSLLFGRRNVGEVCGFFALAALQIPWLPSVMLSGGILLLWAIPFAVTAFSLYLDVSKKQKE